MYKCTTSLVIQVEEAIEREGYVQVNSLSLVGKLYLDRCNRGG